MIYNPKGSIDNVIRLVNSKDGSTLDIKLESLKLSKSGASRRISFYPSYLMVNVSELPLQYRQFGKIGSDSQVKVSGSGDMFSSSNSSSSSVSPSGEPSRMEEVTIMQQTASTGVIMFSCSEFTPIANRIAISTPGASDSKFCTIEAAEINLTLVIDRESGVTRSIWRQLALWARLFSQRRSRAKLRSSLEPELLLDGVCFTKPKS